MRPGTVDTFSDLTRPQAIDRCAWYLRVSTPKQKLEHQREHVLRWCESAGIHIPEACRFEDKEKRHKTAKREQFQELLDKVKAGQLDWIIICSFDRWGVADVDEFFEFRRLLLKHDVQLWSVVDHLNLTSVNDGDFHHIVALAVAATRNMEFMAERNILKMIEMAKQGWAATGNAPYGTDLVCYPLHDLARPLFRVVRLRYRPYLYRILWYSEDSRVERNAEGIITRHRLTVAKEEVTERMPPRDKKATGYRFEPTIEKDRIKAINLAYELYDSGMGWADISRNLWNMGHRHYDKPFQDHALETILGNPAYIGLPAWGKLGTGAYRVLHNGQPMKVRRKTTDTLYIRKDQDQWIQPTKPLYLPLVPADLFQRVGERLAERGHINPSYGKRRTKDRAKHPLNGKLVCPDCKALMVLGSYCPAEGTGKKKTRCFNCGTYRKYGRLKCYANTIGWDRIDRGIERLLATVKDRITAVTDGRNETLREQEWLAQTDLGKTILAICGLSYPEGTGIPRLAFFANKAEMFRGAFREYDRRFQAQAEGLRAEAAEIDTELCRIAEAIQQGIPSQTVRTHLNQRMAALEARKAEIGPKLIPLTAKAETIMEQLAAIRETVERADKAEMGRLLDGFIEKVIPQFETKTGGDGKRRAFIRGFEFIPRDNQAARNILPRSLCVTVAGAMENGASHTDRDSSPRSG